MKNRYALITAARNEGALIQDTIKCVLSQSILPVVWIIVDDNSRDNTDEVVTNYSKQHDFIKLLKYDGTIKRNFASKVDAINVAYEEIKRIDFDFIGILDADITFEDDYYEKMLVKFDKNPKLGIAGGGFYDLYDGKKIKIPYSPYSVRGAVQLFRKRCYEDIGGLLPLSWGGYDAVACSASRKEGWEVRTFEEKIVNHNRRTGIVGINNILVSKIREGKREYNRGVIPLAQFLKCIYRIKEAPFFIGSVLQLIGYWWMKIRNDKIIIDEELLKYIKHEQKLRMKGKKIL